MDNEIVKIYAMLDAVLQKYTKHEDRKDNEIHITEIVRCLRRSYYERKHKPEKINLSILRGITMHEVISKAFVELFGGEREKTFTKDINGITIKGTIDYINKDEDFLIEIKTSAYQNITSMHVNQAKGYILLSGVSKAFILLISNNIAIVTKVEKDEYIEEILINRAIELHNSLIKHIPPTSTVMDYYSNECRYCPFTVECENDQKL